MDCIWECLTLICVNVIIFGSRNIFVACNDSKYSLEFNQSKPITNVHDFIESTTESFVKKKNVDWKNNNILRDKDTHSFNTENVKSILDDIMKNGELNKSDATSTNLENVRLPIPQPFTTTSSVDRVEKSFNLPDNLPRNTRDLILDSESSSNGTDIATNNSIVAVRKENITVGLDRSNRTLFVPVLLPDKASSDRTVTVSNQANISSITSLPPFVKNPKDKASKPKMDMNPKQFKKPSNSFKNKSHVISNYNATIEAIKPENTSEYIVDDSVDDNVMLDNLTHTVSWINESREHDPSNATLLSLRTPPEPEGWQPLSIILIGTGIIALISIVIAIGMFSVVLYRRYQWNKPQTFSDKCSNADSTGYIDDSTLKENSEEMYSLDNDSFLNSLEAMTIQNYWADSIRHTKL